MKCYKSFGYDRFYDAEYYDMNEQDTKKLWAER